MHAESGTTSPWLLRLRRVAGVIRRWLRSWQMTPYAYVFDRYRRRFDAQRLGDPGRVRTPGTRRLVSVVLPVYNGEDYIEQAVRSVLAQSYSDFELLVVDDGSTDRTWAILARLTMEDARIRLIRQKNQRLPSALAAGFRAATGEFLTWTSADNVLKPGCLETLVDELRAHPERDLVYANLDIIGPDGVPLEQSAWFAGYQVPRGSPHVHLPTDPSELNIWPNNYVGAAFLYKASVPYLIGDYSRYLFGLEDYDYWMRLNAALCLRHSDVVEPLYDYRFHDTSLTARDRELRITARRDALMVFEEFRRDFLLAPTLWSVTHARERESLAAAVIAELRAGNRQVVDLDRLRGMTLPSCWCPVVHVHVGAASDCASPPADLSEGILQVLLLNETSLPREVHDGWHLALVCGSPAVLPRTYRPRQGWLAADRLGELLQAAELRAKSDQFAAIETLIHEPPSQPLQASVVICTCRRPDLLNRVVESLAAQEGVSDLTFEVLIVNNDPDDASVAQDVDALRLRHFADVPSRLRLIDCPFAGLSFARNFGVAAALGAVLLFLDDDSIPEKSWLRVMVRAFAEHPEAGVIGGAIQLVLPDPKPTWIEPDWHGYWSQFDPQAPIYQAAMQYWQLPYGANWGCRREAIIAAGGFRTEYGRKGGDFGGGEELVAGCVVQALGYRVGIEPESIVRHAVDPDRFTLDHVARTIRAGINVAYQCHVDQYFHSGVTVRFGVARALHCALRALRAPAQAERVRQSAYAAAHGEVAMRQFRDHCLRMRRPHAARAGCGASRSVREVAVPVPDVSVIVPVYNKVAHLRDCLESILSQSLRTIEVICVDDGSTDGSRAVLHQSARDDPRIRVIELSENRGPGLARNAGLAAACGVFVQFTDADDLLPSDALALLLRRAQSDRVEVVRGGIAGFDTAAPGASRTLDSPPALSRFRPMDHRAFWVPWWHTSYLFSRAFLRSHRIAYPDLANGEDPVFLARVLTGVPLISVIPQVTYRYRSSSGEHRRSYRHLRDYLDQAEQIRELFLPSVPAAWFSGFAPAVLPEIETLIERVSMSDDERRTATAETARVFELPRATADARGRPRFLFMYKVCGLGGVEASIANKIEALRSVGAEARALFQSHYGEGGYLAARQPGFMVVGSHAAQQRVIRDFDPDLVMVIDSPSMLDVIGLAGVRCPIAFESHVPDPGAMDWQYQGGISDARLSGFVVPSAFSRSLLVALGVDAARVTVIPNPINPERFRPRPSTEILETIGVPAKRIPVLFVGRLEPQKDPVDFVRLARRLENVGGRFHCILLGDAVEGLDYAETVRAEARSVRDITFVSRMAYSDMELLYSAVAASGGCLVSTSRHESQPMVMLEAMACGCPVVATDVGGIREFLENGVTAYVYQAGDLDAAARAVQVLATDRSRRQAIVQAGIDYVGRHHGLTAAARAYVDLQGILSARVREMVEPPRPIPPPDESPVDLDKQRLADAVAGLLARPGKASGPEPLAPYQEVAPGVRIGFEPSANVMLAVSPVSGAREVDGTRRLILDYRPPSGWLSIEFSITWDELKHAQQYRFELSGRASRPMPCRVVLKLPQADGTSEEVRLCDILMTTADRSARGAGYLRKLFKPGSEDSCPSKIILFLDASAALHLELDDLAIELI